VPAAFRQLGSMLACNFAGQAARVPVQQLTGGIGSRQGREVCGFGRAGDGGTGLHSRR
jgi:hypothetical protein